MLQEINNLIKDTAKGPLWTGAVHMDHGDRLTLPLRQKKPRAYFLTSMGDVFHPKVPDDYIYKLSAIMALCPHHLFIVLTKRPERMRNYMSERSTARSDGRGQAVAEFAVRFGLLDSVYFELLKWPLPNVWLLTSVANQAEVDELIPTLLQTPAATRGVSVEPMVGPIDLYNADIDPRVGHTAKGTYIGEYLDR